MWTMTLPCVERWSKWPSDASVWLRRVIRMGKWWDLKGTWCHERDFGNLLSFNLIQSLAGNGLFQDWRCVPDVQGQSNHIHAWFFEQTVTSTWSTRRRFKTQWLRFNCLLVQVEKVSQKTPLSDTSLCKSWERYSAAKHYDWSCVNRI